MLKNGYSNENIVLAEIFKFIPQPHSHFTYHVPFERAKTFRDGWYVFQDMSIPKEWVFRGKNRNPMNPMYNMDKILKFAENRFGHNQYECELKKKIANCKKNASDRSFDMVIVYVENHVVVKWACFEVASEDHFNGDEFLSKTISDCLKLNCDYANPSIIYTRKKDLPTLSAQVYAGLKNIL